MSQEKVSKIVESELEISGISDMSIEEEVKSSKKEFESHLQKSVNLICWHLIRSKISHFSGPGIHGSKLISAGRSGKSNEISERTRTRKL